MDSDATLCKECGSLIAWGRAKRRRCHEHPKASTFFVKRKLAKEHKYAYANAYMYGVSVEGYRNPELDEDDDEDDDD